MEEVMDMRDGFILHEKTMKQIGLLSNEQAGELLKAMVSHYNGEESEEVSQIVSIIMVDVIDRMDADTKAYEKSIEQRKNAANKRWNNAKECETDAKECDRIREACETDAENAVSVSDSVSVKKERTVLTDSKKETKHIYGEYKNVRLTDTEYQKMVDAHGEEDTLEAIRIMDEYKETYGKKYKSDYLAMNKWVWKRLGEERKKTVQMPRSSPTKGFNWGLSEREDKGDNDSNIAKLIAMQTG